MEVSLCKFVLSDVKAALKDWTDTRLKINHTYKATQLFITRVLR